MSRLDDRTNSKLKNLAEKQSTSRHIRATHAQLIRNPCATLRNDVSLHLSPQILIHLSNTKTKKSKHRKLKIQISLHFDFEMLNSGLLEGLNDCCFCQFKETQFINLLLHNVMEPLCLHSAKSLSEKCRRLPY